MEKCVFPNGIYEFNGGITSIYVRKRSFSSFLSVLVYNSFRLEKDMDKCIRKSTLDDLPRISEILYGCRNFMKNSGNPNQWEDMDRVIRKTKEDIALGNSYVYIDEGVIHAVFTLALGIDPTYILIENGQWLNDEPYVTIHRIGSDFSRRGILKMAVELALTMANNVRVDTSNDNAPMRNGLEKLGFRYCGIIYIDTGESRLAYQLEK